MLPTTNITNDATGLIPQHKRPDSLVLKQTQVEQGHNLDCDPRPPIPKDVTEGGSLDFIVNIYYKWFKIRLRSDAIVSVSKSLHSNC